MLLLVKPTIKNSCLIFLIFMSFGVHSQNSLRIDSSVRKAILDNGQENPGVKFREFNATSVSGINYTRDSLNGKICLVNFWFASCEPCIAEFDALNDIYRKYKDDKNFKFFSITYEEPETARNLVAKYHLEYPVLCVSHEDIHKLIFNLGYPTTIITNQQSDIIYIKCGGSNDKDRAQKDMNKYFSEKLEKLLAVNKN